MSEFVNPNPLSSKAIKVALNKGISLYMTDPEAIEQTVLELKSALEISSGDNYLNASGEINYSRLPTVADTNNNIAGFVVTSGENKVNVLSKRNRPRQAGHGLTIDYTLVPRKYINAKPGLVILVNNHNGRWEETTWLDKDATSSVAIKGLWLLREKTYPLIKRQSLLGRLALEN